MSEGIITEKLEELFRDAEEAPRSAHSRNGARHKHEWNTDAGAGIVKFDLEDQDSLK